MDHAEKIHALTLVIKSLCEENNLSKIIVIEDFIDMMKCELKDIHKLLDHLYRPESCKEARRCE